MRQDHLTTRPEHGRHSENPESDLLTPGQVARRLQVSSAWVRDHATRKTPRLPAVKMGKLLRFRREDVDRFIREQCA
jgi:excisionase family DNA binding protein